MKLEDEMIYREESIFIKQPKDKIFRIALNIDKHPEFIPNKDIKILDRGDKDKVIYWTSANVLGIRFGYISERTANGNNLIKIKQIKGPMKGLQTELRFEESGNQGTILKVIHIIRVPIPIIGNLIASLIYLLFIRRMATEFLVKIKERVGWGNQ